MSSSIGTFSDSVELSNNCTISLSVSDLGTKLSNLGDGGSDVACFVVGKSARSVDAVHVFKSRAISRSDSSLLPHLPIGDCGVGGSKCLVATNDGQFSSFSVLLPSLLWFMVIFVLWLSIML